MKKIICNLRVKKDVDLSKLGPGFNWETYEPEKGVLWTNGAITVFGSSREIFYERMTQQVFDSIVQLCMEGKVEWIKK